MAGGDDGRRGRNVHRCDLFVELNARRDVVFAVVEVLLLLLMLMLLEMMAIDGLVQLDLATLAHFAHVQEYDVNEQAETEQREHNVERHVELRADGNSAAASTARAYKIVA